jgi:hypothetical protein
MIYTNITLGELLSSQNETIKRNAISILKQYQKRDKRIKELETYELKIIDIKDDYIDWERDDGVKGRDWDYNWANKEITRYCLDCKKELTEKEYQYCDKCIVNNIPF